MNFFKETFIDVVKFWTIGVMLFTPPALIMGILYWVSRK